VHTEGDQLTEPHQLSQIKVKMHSLKKKRPSLGMSRVFKHKGFKDHTPSMPKLLINDSTRNSLPPLQISERGALPNVTHKTIGFTPNSQAFDKRYNST
jgi:hypothetical protein